MKFSRLCGSLVLASVFVLGACSSSDEQSADDPVATENAISAGRSEAEAVVASLLRVQNRPVDDSLAPAERQKQVLRKVDDMVAHFSSDYVSLAPQLPGAGFQGTGTIRQHWTGIFSLSNFKVEIVQSPDNVATGRSTSLAVLGRDTVISKQIWSGDFPGGHFSTEVLVAYKVEHRRISEAYLRWGTDVAPPPPPAP